MARDTPYAFSRTCTWHGSPAAAALRKPNRVNGETVTGLGCPHCGAVVVETPSAWTWWAGIKRSAKAKPEIEKMVLWGQGKCFPDPDTLENAYRQAMEE